MRRVSISFFTSRAMILRRPLAGRCSRCWAHLPSSREGQRRSRSGEGEWDKARPTSVDPTVETRILELKASGDGILKIGRKLGIGTSVVQRVFKQEPQLS
jgi:hypothetical protein